MAYYKVSARPDMTEKLLTGTLSLNTNKTRFQENVTGWQCHVRFLGHKAALRKWALRLQYEPTTLDTTQNYSKRYNYQPRIGPRQANLVLIAYASSEGSGEPAHPRSLARTFAARSYKQWVKRNLQTESQIPGPSEWLGMRSSNLSWRNARRHKFAWRGSITILVYSPQTFYVRLSKLYVIRGIIIVLLCLKIQNKQ